jgi:hypothetical protein
MHCSRQFTDALSVDECSKAVVEAFQSGYSCFPMNSVVNRKGDGRIPLIKLRVGDEVLVASDEGSLKYDPIIAFLHWSNKGKHSFLQIQYGDCGSKLTVHRDHFIPVQSHTNIKAIVAANDINVGDKIQSLWIDGTLVNSPGISISEVEELGLCCPVTMSGRIIVDSVDCSCYSPPLGILPFKISHDICHFVMGPMRLHYQLNKDKLVKEGQTTTTEEPIDGLHPYARVLMTAVTGVLFS